MGDFEEDFSIDAPGDFLQHTSNSWLRVTAPVRFTNTPKTTVEAL